MDVYFSKMIVEVLTGENASFYRNLFVNMDYRASRRVTDNLATGEEEKIGNSTVISIEEERPCLCRTSLSNNRSFEINH